jgi:hypothetical protein
MAVLGRRRERERVDPRLGIRNAQAERPAAEQRGELLEAGTQIEDEGDRVVLLRVRQQEVQEKRLPGAGGTEDQRVTDVFMMEAPLVWRVLFGAECRQAVAVA